VLPKVDYSSRRGSCNLSPRFLLKIALHFIDAVGAVEVAARCSSNTISPHLNRLRYPSGSGQGRFYKARQYYSSIRTAANLIQQLSAAGAHPGQKGESLLEDVVCASDIFARARLVRTANVQVITQLDVLFLLTYRRLELSREETIDYSTVQSCGCPCRTRT
jgi:hypothetical protein